MSPNDAMIPQNGPERNSRYQVGEFVIDLEQKLLHRGDQEIRLPRKTFELLVYFLRNPNRVIEKETLMMEVWPGTIVEDANLTVHISALRKALGSGKEDGPERNPTIETFPKIGYRFSGDVRGVEHEGGPRPHTQRDNELPTAEPVSHDLDRSRSAATPRIHSRVLVVSLGAALVIGVGALGLWIWKISNKPVQPTMTRVAGTENGASLALSPNGEYIAQAVSEGGKRVLEILHIESGSRVQLLPPDEALFWGITFSKDGSHIYFIKTGPEFKTLYKIPFLGGPVTKVLDRVGHKISFSPDGSQFCYVKDVSDSGRSTIAVVNADGSGERELASRARPQFYSSFDLSWSPNAKLIASAAGSGGNNPDTQIVGIEVETGQEVLLSDHRWSGSDGLVWLPDGSGLIAALWERPTDITQVWLIPQPPAKPSKITTDLENYGAVAISSDGETIMAGKFKDNTSLWIVPAGRTDKAEQVKTGKHHNFRWVRWLTDTVLVFGSDAGGNRDVWRVNTDGTDERMLTDGPQSNVMPVGTADGRYIVFSAFRDDNRLFQLWRMESDGSNQQQLTRTGDGASQPALTPDGKWVFYTAGEMDGPPIKRRIWKVPMGGGEPELFIDIPAFGPDISSDGRLLACWIKKDKSSPAQAAIFSIDGGAPIKVFDFAAGGRLDWTPDGTAISFIRTVDGVSNIWSQPIDGGEPRQETQFTSETINNFEWSNDGRLVCSRFFKTRDAVLIRNFR